MIKNRKGLIILSLGLIIAAMLTGCMGNDNRPIATPNNNILPGNNGVPNEGMPNDGTLNDGTLNDGTPNNEILPGNTIIPNNLNPGTVATPAAGVVATPLAGAVATPPVGNVAPNGAN